MRSFNMLAIICLMLCCGDSALAQKKENVSKEDYIKVKESDNEVFVITSDSVKHSGTKLKFPPRYFNNSHYIAIDDVKYSRKNRQDIIAYQTEDSYQVYLPSLGDDMSRVRKGKMNLYVYYVFTTTIGHATADRARRYVFEIEKNKFITATYENLEKAFADNNAVLQKFHELFPDQKDADKIFLKVDIPFKVERKTLVDMLSLVDMYNGN